MTLQSIFITGAASGIGRATAQLFHSHGWLVGGYDIDADALTDLRAELGDRCVTGVLDVRDKAAFEAAMADFATASDGRLDVMFNNAGIAVMGHFDDVPFERTRDIVDINFMGVLNGVHVAIELLKQTPNSLCFSTSSSAATFGTPGLAVYAATKFAVKGLTEALSVELARYGCRAGDVSPGIIDTAIWHSSSFGPGEVERPLRNMAEANVERTDAGRTLPAGDVAACVWQAYHGDRIHWYVPPEVVEREQAKMANAEQLRDELIAEAAGRSL